MENKRIPGFTGYKPQYTNENDEVDNNKNLRDNRFFIPGYQGYVPNVKSENHFGTSYGKASCASIKGDIPKGFIQTP